MDLRGSATYQAPDTESVVSIPLYLLVKLLEANGGAIAIDGYEIATTGSKQQVEMVELRDPWRLIVKLVDPKESEWHDPTYGKIDRDIQEYVMKNYPEATLGQRTAFEETLQNKRNRGERVL